MPSIDDGYGNKNTQSRAQSNGGRDANDRGNGEGAARAAAQQEAARVALGQQQEAARQQQAAQQAQEAQLAFQASQSAALNGQAQESAARAQKLTVEAQVIPQELEIDRIKAVTTNLKAGDADDKEFQKRLEISKQLLKEREVAVKENSKPNPQATLPQGELPQ